MSNPKLSLCMIVRNAEDTLPKLLGSIQNHFDEYVFVDTGSTDATIKMLETFAEYAGVPIRICDFEWIDDFAAARNFAFAQATGDWRMYLDADDELVNGKALRAEIEATEKYQPDANAITLPYTYRQDDAEQEVLRIMKWVDGWHWMDEIHEFVDSPKGRKRVVITGVKVVHHKEIEDGMKAVARNARIAQKAYDTADNGMKKGRMAAYLAADNLLMGRYDDAATYYDETIRQYNGNPFAVFAYEDYIRMEMARGKGDRALQLACELAGRHPEWPEGALCLTAVHNMNGEHWRAIQSWEEAQRKQPLDTRILENIWWTKGVCAVRAAESYISIGSYDQALAVLAKVPQGIQQHENVRHFFNEMRAKAVVQHGEKLAREWAEFLLWTCEPAEAWDFLRARLPPVLKANQGLFLMKGEIKKRIEHIQSRQKYEEAYASIPAETYHTDTHHRESVLGLARVKRLLQWATVPYETHRSVLAVGFQDGIIEQALLEKDRSLVLMVADIAPQASKGFVELEQQFPGRVFRHQMDGLYDFAPAGAKFDLVTAFEVIEHVPNHVAMLMALQSHVKQDGGTLMLSTPVSSRWIETHLSNFKAVQHPYWHVRSFTHRELRNLQDQQMLSRNVELIQAEDSTYVMTIVNDETPPSDHEISIYVPSTPQPFDVESPERGFLGGSEEAVIRLADALTQAGALVTVYAPMPSRSDNCKIRMKNGVLWCDPEEFIPQEGTTVLYWRCPAVMDSKLVQVVPHRKFLWLHDAWYAASVDSYNKADKTLILSEAHRRSITAHDGSGINNMVIVGNGIMPDLFPSPDETEREQKTVIYASSPERGLETILDQWPFIQHEVPDAKLEIYYDWKAYASGMPTDYLRLKGKLDSLMDDGFNVVYHGGVDQPTLHAAFRKASLWCYPNTGDVETYCITALKAQASGCMPVASDAGALPEVISRDVELFPATDLPERAADFAQGVVDALLKPPTLEERIFLRRDVLEHKTWEKVAQKIIALIEE